MHLIGIKKTICVANSDSNFIACNVKSLLKAGDKIILVTMDRGRLAIEAPYIHIFVFTHRKNNQFQNRLKRRNPNI